MRLMMALLLLATNGTAMAAGMAAEVVAQDAWIRLLPGDLPAAGYVQLQNQSARALQLTGVTATEFESITLHRSMRENGVAHMQAVHEITIAPGKSFSFAPGGYHLMLYGKKTALTIGGHILMNFVFSDGEKLPVKFELRGAAG